MENYSVAELKHSWADLQPEVLGKQRGQKGPLSKLRKLLKQAIEAGEYISNVGERGDLQALAREIADFIFELTDGYPTATILPLRGASLPLTDIHNIPYPANPVFIDREEELESLRKQLLEKSAGRSMRAIICGLGGVGKTQLAVEFAWKHFHDFNAVLWVRADSPDVLDSELAALAKILALEEVIDREQLIQIRAVLEWLRRQKRWLLIADNADTEAAVSAIEHRLPTDLPGAVLITSRLNQWPVNISRHVLEQFSASDANRFLLARVRKGGHYAGDEKAANCLAEELGYLPLALEQAAAFTIEMRWDFGKYVEYFRAARFELMSKHGEGGTRYPDSIATTWGMTLDQLSPLARAILRIAAWFAPTAIPRGVFTADKRVFSEATLWNDSNVLDLAVDEALGELGRFSLIHLEERAVSVHRLLQAVEQDSLTGEGNSLWLEKAVKLLNAFVLGTPEDLRMWDTWNPWASHAAALIEHAKDFRFDALPIAIMASNLGLFLKARAVYPQAEELLRTAVNIFEKWLGQNDPTVARALNDLEELLQATNRLKEAEQLIHRSLDIGEFNFGEAHPSVAESLNNLAELNRTKGNYAEAKLLYERAQSIWEASLGPEDPNVAASLNNLANLSMEQGRYDDSQLLYERALAIWEKAFGPEHPDVATSLNNLAVLGYEQGRYEEAESFCDRALSIRQKILGPEHPGVAKSLNILAALSDIRGQYEKAEALYKRALAIREKILGAEHPGVATSLNNLAELHRIRGKYAEAEQICKRALAIWENAFGPEHPDVAASLNNLARLYRMQGRYADAELICKRALGIWGRMLGSEHPYLAAGLNNLTSIYIAQRRYAEAEPECGRALFIREKALGLQHPDVAESLSNLAELYEATGRYEESESLCKRALAIREKAFGPEHPAVAESLNNLAELHTATGRYEECESVCKRALAIREKVFGLEHPDVADSLSTLAELYMVTGRYEESESECKRALAIREKVLGSEHPDVAESLNNLTKLYRVGRSPDIELPWKSQ